MEAGRILQTQAVALPMSLAVPITRLAHPGRSGGMAVSTARPMRAKLDTTLAILMKSTKPMRWAAPTGPTCMDHSLVTISVLGVVKRLLHRHTRSQHSL